MGRRGPKTLDEKYRRGHRISIYLCPSEYQELAKRLGLGEILGQPVLSRRLSRYIRDLAFDRHPPVVPEINRQAWVSLAKLAGNLNQISHAINAGNIIQTTTGIIELLVQIRGEITTLRGDLIGR